jgi:membrane-bound lytic murein transglycosylase D
MGSNRSLCRRLLFLVAVVGWCCGGLASRASGNEPRLEFEEVLEVPRSIEARVRFWVDVFTRWSVEDAVVQDRDHPWVVFAVVPIAKPSREELGRVRQEYTALARRVERALARPETPAAKALVGEDGELWRRLRPPVLPAAFAEARDRIEVRPGQREIFLDSLARSKSYVAAMRRLMRDAGLPEEIAWLPHVESSFNADARSNVGAVGIWQLMPETARRTLRVDGGVDERRDPVRSTLAAARYFREAHDALGNWPLAVTSYNYGVNGMRRAIEALGTADLGDVIERHDSPAFGYSAKNFFAQFLAAVHISQHESFYFPRRTRAGGGDPPPLRPARATVLCTLRPGATTLLEPPSPPTLAAFVPGLPGPEATASPSPALVFEAGPADRRLVRTGSAPPVVQATRGGGATAHGGAAGEPRGRPGRIAPPSPDPPVATARAAREYVVRKGDTLWTIARQHGTTVEAIRLANRAVPQSAQLQLGQRLLITG